MLKRSRSSLLKCISNSSLGALEIIGSGALDIRALTVETGGLEVLGSGLLEIGA